MNIKNLYKNLIDKIYKVNDVQQGYFYWVNALLDICMDIFKYDNLPTSIPEEEIEKRLLTFGYCGFLHHPDLGLIVCNGHPYDYDLYGRYRRMDFYNPYFKFNSTGFYPGNKEIGVDCEIIYNLDTEKYLNVPIQGQMNFYQKICRYARQLADIESTINLDIINSRQPYLLVAGNQQVKESIVNIFRSLRRGENESINDTDFMKEIKSLKNKDIINGHLTELIESRNTLIKYFLSEIGIYSTDDKKERLIVDEVQQENRNVKVFLYSMLKCRQQGIERVNALYGTDIKVTLRPELFNEIDLYKYTDIISDTTEEEVDSNDI